MMAGLTHVPVLVRTVADRAALAMALIENIQRENLNPLEEAVGIQRLIDEFEMTHQSAAEAVGRSRSAASNLLRLLKLPELVQTMLLENKLDMGHARALLALDGAQQITAANKICIDNLSVREAEKLIQILLNPIEKTPPKAVEKSRDVLRLQEDLSERIGSNVTIKEKNKGAGQLIIDYVSHEQLEELIANLQKL
jgi:ParB family chromosome partitioning protein